SYGAPRRSVAEALTALGVEQVSVLRGGPEVHRLPLARRTTRIDTGDERLVRLVGTGATAVDEGVRAELLDQVDLDGQALVVGGDLQVLGAHAHGHRGLVGLREGGAVHGQDRTAELDALIAQRRLEQVHGRGADEARDEDVVRVVVHAT